ncbi:hypothetical protein THII_2281 [Thioploca ingrica]|uniref:Uncharacterized protein n=1 Tax=Thioploca ingrica TaxID=40754 RepID=A0A090AEW4_9GAMM|nr:hypothetical protein THII_2281 [Thioploca ingrica]
MSNTYEKIAIKVIAPLSFVLYSFTTTTVQGMGCCAIGDKSQGLKATACYQYLPDEESCKKKVKEPVGGNINDHYKWFNNMKCTDLEYDGKLCPLPLIVTLSSFKSTAIKNRVLIEWQTVAEPDSLGFYLWRGNPVNGKCSLRVEDYTNITLLNKPHDKPILFDSSGSDTEGNRYFYVDYDVKAGTTYCYLLQDVDSQNQTTEYWNFIDSATVKPEDISACSQ